MDMAQKCKFWNNLRFVIWGADEFIWCPKGIATYQRLFFEVHMISGDIFFFNMKPTFHCCDDIKRLKP